MKTNYALHTSLLEVTMFSCLTVHKSRWKSNFVLHLLENKDGLQEKEFSSGITVQFLYW